MSVGGTVMAEKPMFSTEQIVSSSDLQRRWKERIIPKLSEYPFLMIFSGSEPKAVVMSHDQFESMWAQAQEAVELRLQHEVMSRVVKQIGSKEAFVPLADLVAETNILPEELAGGTAVEKR